MLLSPRSCGERSSLRSDATRGLARLLGPFVVALDVYAFDAPLAGPSLPSFLAFGASVVMGPPHSGSACLTLNLPLQGRASELSSWKVAGPDLGGGQGAILRLRVKVLSTRWW